MKAIFDARWRKRALGGDEKAISTLAAEVMTPLYRFCLYRVGRDSHLCEDVVQETLVRAVRDLKRYDPARCNNDVFGWLTGLARNEIRRALSQRDDAVSLEAMWMRMDRELLTVLARLESEPFDEKVLAEAETREVVNAAMAQLPPRYGEALEAKYVAGRSVREIASAWRVSEKAVESLLSRAREAFRTAFLSLTGSLSAENT